MYIQQNNILIKYVVARPIISGSQADSMTAALGSKASMSCEAVGYPQPDITWYRKDGQMPRFVLVHVLLFLCKQVVTSSRFYFCNVIWCSQPDITSYRKDGKCQVFFFSSMFH